MVRFAVFTLVIGFGVPGLAGAATLDDFFARGYTVAASTTLAGNFTGCVRQHRLEFADGSVFACARTMAQIAYAPRVYILRLGGDAPSVVLVGSRVQAGELLRLRLHDYPVPLRMDPDPQLSGPAPPGLALAPVGPIPSIDTLMQQQNAPLSAQQTRLPTPPPKNRSSR
jgi:hypothetical protein